MLTCPGAHSFAVEDIKDINLHRVKQGAGRRGYGPLEMLIDSSINGSMEHGAFVWLIKEVA